MSKESIQGPLSALRNAGTVCGVCLARGSEVLVNLFPFSEGRVGDMAMALEDIQAYFSKKDRVVDQMSFGYDGGCVTVVEDGEFRLMVMHMLADEVDFIAKAARAFLADFQLNLFAEQISADNPRLVGLIDGAAAESTEAAESTDAAKPAEPRSPRRPLPVVVPAKKNAPAVEPEPTDSAEAAPGSGSAPEPAEVPQSAEAPESVELTESAGAAESAAADPGPADPGDDWQPDLRELSGPPPGAVPLPEPPSDTALKPPRRPREKRP